MKQIIIMLLLLVSVVTYGYEVKIDNATDEWNRLSRDHHIEISQYEGYYKEDNILQISLVFKPIRWSGEYKGVYSLSDRWQKGEELLFIQHYNNCSIVQFYGRTEDKLLSSLLILEDKIYYSGVTDDQARIIIEIFRNKFSDKLL